MKKNAIALLITMLFIMAITVSMGIGLKYVNEASNEVGSENFMLQTSVILDDVLTLLKTSKELNAIVEDGSGDAFYMFLAQSEFIPFESSGIKISLSLKSARAKLNPNILVDANKSVNLEKVNALRQYFSNKMINQSYVDFLIDNMSNIKEDFSYNSDIFNDKPYLFRDYISSYEHLDEINDFYEKTFHENSLKNVDFKNLFYFSADTNSSIDANYATAEVWELMLGCDKLRAEQLTLEAGSYTDEKSLNLSDDEKDKLFVFQDLLKYEAQFFLAVSVEIMQNTQSAKINFEYDIRNHKGYNFNYEI